MPIKLAIDELLYTLLKTTDLLKFAPILAKDSITKVDHLKDVTNSELSGYGLSQPAIRRLRAAFMDKELQKKIEKRIKKKKEIRFVDISNIEEYKPSPPSQQQAVEPPTTQRHDPPHTNNDDVPSTSAIGPSLIFKEDIKLMEGLGEGTFAVVKRALWTRTDNKKIDVAVKIIREINEEVKKDLQVEINTMSKLRHNNLITLFGVVLGDPMLMVMEFCEGGALLDRLRNTEKPVLLATQLLNYSVQIASGMMYLEQKGYVHRDLATRNVLLTNNEQQVKICDFGLSRVVDENERLYILQGVKKVPFSWCPPESLRRRIFSSASDVWAYGVTIWELWTYGEEPWVGYGALKVLEATERGERLRRPEHAPDNVFDLMYSCWALKPEDRPDFPKIYWLFNQIKFETVEVKSDHYPTIPAHIEVKRGDRFIILSEASPTTIHGQNVTTRKYGYVPKTVLSNKPIPTLEINHNHDGVKPIRQAPIKPVQSTTFNTNSAQNNQEKPKLHPAPLPESKPFVRSNKPEISLPVRNSLIHAGHGDSNTSWGDPGKIPDVYLKNPVTNPVVSTNLRGTVPIDHTVSNNKQSNVTRTPSTDRSLGSSGYGTGRDRTSTISSVEQWNKLNMSSTNGGTSLPPPPQGQTRKQSDINFRQRIEDSLVPRPKTTMDLPTVPSHHLPPPSNPVKKPSMDEIRRGNAAFSWVEDLTKNKQFRDRATVNESDRKHTSTAPITIHQLKSNDSNSQSLSNMGLMKSTSGSQISTTTANSASTLSTLTLANTKLPTDFNSVNGPDPFEIPVHAKTVISKPSYTQSISTIKNVDSIFNKNTNTTSTSSNGKNVSRMDPPPVMKPFNTIGPSSSKKMGEMMLNELESRNGQLQVTPQQVANACPLNELMKTKDNINPQPNNRRLTALDIDLKLPPPSLLYNSLSKNNESSIIRPRPTSTIPTVTTNVNLNNKNQPVLPLTSTATTSNRLPTANNFLPSTPLPRPKVIPGTAPPSGAVIDSLISSLTTPQQQTAIGWDPDAVGRQATVYLNAQTQNTSLSPPASPNSFVSTNTKSTNNDNKEKLLEEVKKAVPNAEDNDYDKKCRSALIKHNFNVEMAIKQLKVERLLSLGITKDSACAASALDSADWDLNTAAAKLLQ